MYDDDYHMALGRSESSGWDVKLICGECGGPAEGNITCDDDHICNACDLALGGEDGN